MAHFTFTSNHAFLWERITLLTCSFFWYNEKQNVIKWESQFYKNEIEKGVFIAPIDTTFALYRPFSRRGRRDGSDFMIRVGMPYSCYHMPWYVNSAQLDEEETYYKQKISEKTHWSSK